jgi:8-oxo-dGTP pyrophosphatase MutT (NUDIX family)
MKEVKISTFDNNINVYYTDKRICLPVEYRSRVDTHWNELIKSGKSFFNGDIFSISRIECKDDEVNIFVGLTDYAHFLYTIHNKSYSELDCRVIYTSVMIETSDEKYAIGVMNTNTAFPDKLQFIGGGIDRGDIMGGIIDLRHSIEKEINEELGIDVDDGSIVKSLQPCFLKSGGDSGFLSAIFKMELLIDENQLTAILRLHNEKTFSLGDKPEIRALVFVDKGKDSISSFIDGDRRMKDENLAAALMADSGMISIEGFHGI